VRRPTLISSMLLLVVTIPVIAQQTATPVAARPEDVASEDAIIGALYDVISGAAGEKRDWDRFRSLFAPGARLIPTGKRSDGTRVMRVLTPEDYINTSAPGLERDGFFEKEVRRVSESFGNITHAFSTYESFHKRGETTPFMRGINSIQLMNDGTRWWVVTIFWDSERPDNPIPARYDRQGR